MLHQNGSLSWGAFIDWAFLALVSFIGWRVINNVDHLTDSVNMLNANVINYSAEIRGLRRDIDRHEDRINEESRRIGIIEKRSR